MNNPKLLFIWDFHGVLEKNNEYAVQHICKKVTKKFGFDVKVYLRDVRHWYGLTWLEYFVNLTKEQDKQKLREMVEEAREVSKDIVHKYIKPMDYAEQVLREIKKSGNVNIVISNTRQDRIEHFVKILGLERYFDGMVGIDGHVRFKFSTPKEKAKAIERLSTDRDYVRKIIIGDSESDIQAGKIARKREKPKLIEVFQIYARYFQK